MAQAFHQPHSLFEMPLPASIRKSLSAGDITPELFGVLRQGQDLLEKGNPEAALECFMKALDIWGENPFTLRVIGAFMFSLQLYHDALSIYLRLQDLEPNELDVLHSIATLLYSLREFDSAMEMIRGLLEQHPQEAPLWLTAGLIASELGCVNEAKEFFEFSRTLNPDDVTVHMNLGWLHRLAGRLDEAAAAYEVAFATNPNSLSSRFNQALVLLARGDYLQGLQAYEVRTKPGSHAAVLRDIDLPLWTGGRFTSERVLVGGEQGIGDQLHFATDLSVLLEDLKEPVVEVHHKLLPLFKRTFPGVEIRPQMLHHEGGGHRLLYPWIREEGRHFDRLINVGSVPLYVRSTRGEWPARGKGYLKPDPERTEAFGRWLRSLGTRPKVGVVWRSQFAEGKRTNAYSPLWLWAELLRGIGDVTFVSMQYSNAAQGIAELRDQHGIVVHDVAGLDQLNDVDGVAALAANLDFVVGAKTAPVVLAASVGVPALAASGATPWAAPLADGHDPWLPALREVGGITWQHVTHDAQIIAREWVRHLESGMPIVPVREAFR